MNMPLPHLALALLASFTVISTARADVPVFIFAGQSNMGGFQTNTHDLDASELAEQPNVLFYGDNGETWQTVNLAARPTQTSNVMSGSGFGPEAIVGKDLVEAHLFPKVLEIKYFKNGSPNDSFLASPEQGMNERAPNPIKSTWAPHIQVTGDQTSLYQGLLDRIKTARAAYTSQFGENTYIAGFFWMQGETDAFSSPEIAKLYDQNLSQFIVALRRDLASPHMPFVYGRIRHGKAFPNDLLVREAQDNVANPVNILSVANVFEVDTDGYVMSGDTVHYSSAGVISMGHDMAKGFEEITKKK